MVLTQLEACCQLINPSPGAWRLILPNPRNGANFINMPLQTSVLSGPLPHDFGCQEPTVELASLSGKGGTQARCDQKREETNNSMTAEQEPVKEDGWMVM